MPDPERRIETISFSLISTSPIDRESSAAPRMENNNTAINSAQPRYLFLINCVLCPSGGMFLNISYGYADKALQFVDEFYQGFESFNKRNRCRCTCKFRIDHKNLLFLYRFQLFV